MVAFPSLTSFAFRTGDLNASPTLETQRCPNPLTRLQPISTSIIERLCFRGFARIVKPRRTDIFVIHACSQIGLCCSSWHNLSESFTVDKTTIFANKNLKRYRLRRWVLFVGNDLENDRTNQLWKGKQNLKHLNSSMHALFSFKLMWVKYNFDKLT